MKNAVVVDANDVKKILAEHFGVDPDIVTANRTKFQYTVSSAHPNVHGQKQIADMLEHFLRGI